MELFLNILLVLAIAFGIAVLLYVGNSRLKKEIAAEDKELATKCHCDAPCNAFCDGEWPREKLTEISKQPLKTYN